MLRCSITAARLHFIGTGVPCSLSPPPSERVDSAQGRNALGSFLGRHQLVPRRCRIIRRPAAREARLEALPRRQPRRAPICSGYLQKILTARVYDVAIEIAARPGAQPVAPPGQPGAAQARGPAVGVQLQAARRLQQDGAPAGRAAGARRDLRLGRQPCAGRGAERAQARLPGGDRDAGDHAAAEGRRGACAGRPRWCCTATATPTPTLHALELEKPQGLSFVHPFDDPDVIAGQGTIAMEILRQHQGPIDAVFVAIGGGGLISGVAAYIKAVRPRDQGDRRADRRFRRHAALGARRQARDAGRRRAVRRRHGGQAGRRGDLPPGARAGRRLRGRRHRRGLRRHQGRVPGHAQHPRARRARWAWRR